MGGQSRDYTIRISGFDPICRINAPVAEFSIRSIDYRTARTAECAVAEYGISMVKPIVMGILEDGEVSYFSIIKDGAKCYSYIILNTPHSDDYYYRIMFKNK